MALPSSYCLTHFDFFPWNCRKKLNETLQLAKTQRQFQHVYFSDQLEDQDDHPDLWLADTVLTFHLKSLKEIKQKYQGIFESQKSGNKTGSGDWSQN